MNLMDRASLITAGGKAFFEKIKEGNASTSLSTLHVNEIRSELKARCLPQSGRKSEMIDTLEEELQGIRRLQILLSNIVDAEPDKNNYLEQHNLSKFEVSPIEPMLDISNMIRITLEQIKKCKNKRVHTHRSQGFHCSYDYIKERNKSC